MGFRTELQAWTELQLRRRGYDAEIRKLLRGYDIGSIDPNDRLAIPPELLEYRNPLREPADAVTLYRGLICIPQDDTCNNGYLPGGTCSPSWNPCSSPENRPLHHAIAPANIITGLLDPKILGNDYDDWPGYTDQKGPEYGSVNWVSSNIGSQGNPEYWVLSWRSYGGRYASILPEADKLFFRGDEWSGLPSFANAITFLGACVAELDGENYLVAAVLNEVAGRELTSNYQNWIRLWAAKPHGCPGETHYDHHGHYPVHFYARTWSTVEAYQNDDAYNAQTNPLGWRDLGAVDCQQYTPATYTRVFTRPRPVGGVYFQRSSNGVEIKACWANLDEWTNLDNSEQLYHVTGYQTAIIRLSGAVEQMSIFNQENGQTVDQDDDYCDFSGGTHDWGCPGGGWNCTSVQLKTSIVNATRTWGETNGRNDIFDPYVVAVDWADDGSLVTAQIVQGASATDGDVSINSRSSRESIQREYWCDPGEPPEFIDGIASIIDLDTEESFEVQQPGGSLTNFNFVVSGANGFSLPWFSIRRGTQYTHNQTWSGTTTFGRSHVCPLDQNVLFPTIAPIGTSSNEMQTREDETKNHGGTSGTRYNTELYYLDLRAGSCAYVQVGAEKWTGGKNSFSYSATDGSGSGIRTDYSLNRDGYSMEIGIVDKGVPMILAQQKNGVDEETLTGTSPWNGETSPTVDPCGPTGENRTPVGIASYPWKSREGVLGFFDVEAIRNLPGDDWTLETVKRDYGAIDETPNMVASWNATTTGFDVAGGPYSYNPVDFGLKDLWNYLSNENAEVYYGIDSEPNPRLAEIGTT